MEEKRNLLKHSQRITNTCERATSTLRSLSSSNLTHTIFTSIANAETKKKAENEWQFEIQNKLLLSSWSELNIFFVPKVASRALFYCFVVLLLLLFFALWFCFIIIFL